MKKKGKIITGSVLLGVGAVMLVGSIIGSNIAFSAESVVNSYFGITPYEVVKSTDKDEDTEYFKKTFDNVEDQKAHDKIYGERLQAEGSVLLKNANKALPLDSGSRNVSLFSFSSYDFVTCGAGSADIAAENPVNLKDAFEEKGMKVNPTLWNFYEDMSKQTYTQKDANDKTQTLYTWGRAQGASGGTGAASFKVNEIPQNEYTSEVKDSYSQYSDAAIVVIARRGGELYDLPVGSFQDGSNLLELTKEEKELLKAIKDSGKFKKTIVLLNTTNAMECDFIDDASLGVDACMWVGYSGAYGTLGIADLLVGDASPSGRLVDTYCNDNTTAPSMVGYYTEEFADFSKGTNGWFTVPSSLDGNGVYANYQEGIYIGYRYYETRYEDVVLGNTSDYDYLSDVKYPFGYGLSYTTFDYSNVKYTFNDKTVDITLDVTNTGNVAGKEVVQAYFQSQYTDYDKQNGIEKSAVELCGFTKTDEIQPGKTVSAKITVDKEEFATYDSKGAKTYIMDEGDYYLSVGKNAHDALNNILQKKGAHNIVAVEDEGTGDADLAYKWTEKMDKTTYSVSSATGEKITNQFDDVELDYYGVKNTMLSRSDWKGTWPEEKAITSTEAMRNAINLYQTYQTPASDTTPMPTTGAQNGLTLAMYIGKDYDDPTWDYLLDQLTFEEMATMIGKGFHNTAACPSVSKPATVDDNGPQGFTTSLISDGSLAVCAYSDENIMAATYDVDLMNEVGKCLGGDMRQRGAVGLYGPAMDTHRSAYGGRNFEYYSEDGFLAGKIAAAEVKGIQSNGVYVYIKHFVLNDQETLCRCVSTFSNEQAVREVYLKPFQIAVTEGGASNVMNSFARIGCTWSGAHKGLMTNVLRNEWGMKGFAITDFSGNAIIAAYGIKLNTFDVAYGLLAGTDTWDSSDTTWTDELINMYKDDAVITTAMRQASHRILYTVANSAAMNGISKSDSIKLITPWWKVALGCLIGVSGAVTLAGAVVLTLGLIKKKEEK